MGTWCRKQACPRGKQLLVLQHPLRKHSQVFSPLPSCPDPQVRNLDAILHTYLTDLGEDHITGEDTEFPHYDR